MLKRAGLARPTWTYRPLSMNERRAQLNLPPVASRERLEWSEGARKAFEEDLRKLRQRLSDPILKEGIQLRLYQEHAGWFSRLFGRLIVCYVIWKAVTTR